MSTIPASSSTIDAHDLRQHLDGVRLLDVRTASEFETAHIHGSYHVPLDTLGEHCADICGVDAEVVLVCQSGNRARQAADKLAAAGMTNMRILEGGMNAWSAAGGDVVRGKEKWSLERQVRLVAGLIVLVSVVASIAVPGLKWVAAFVGAGLTFAAVSNTCAMGSVLARLPYNRGGKADVSSTVDALLRDRPSPTAA